MLGSGYSFPPRTIFIAINSVCNLRCKMCDVGQRKEGTQFYNNLVASKKQLSLVRLKSLVDEVKSFHPTIAITSTEPLLYPDLFNCIKYAVNAGLEVQLTTNGYLLPKYAEDVVNSGATLLQVSIDGPPEIHNRIRGRNDCFQRAYEGIRCVNEIKKVRGKDHPRICVNYSISNYNFNVLMDFMDSIKKLDIDNVLFSHLNFVTKEMAWTHNHIYGTLCPATPTSISAINLSEIDIDVLWEQINDIKKKYKNCYFIPELTKAEVWTFYNVPETFLKNHDRCTVPWQMAQILANGDLTLTTRCFNIRLGNINEQSFMEAWNGEKMRAFRKELRKVGAFPACSRCCGLL